MPINLDNIEVRVSDIFAPPSPHCPGETSPAVNGINGNQHCDDEVPSCPKKKKKKRPKKSAKLKEVAVASTPKTPDPTDINSRPPVLCISRNKHWRYISSYHGPWLQLPLELLESLLVLNLDPATLSASETRFPPHSSSIVSNSSPKYRDRGFQGLGDYSPPESSHGTFSSIPTPPFFPTPKPGRATPPPIDPGVFRSVTSIRKLIDEAAELSVRATSGLSAAALGSMRGASPGINHSPWATAQSLGLNPMGDNSGGRNVAMSAMRVHRLRALAVQKLAQAYKADEIASSVMVMQGGSVFDDVAERVLKTDPSDPDAKYVHFFHEKIPSRQLAESTTTQVLDELIAAYPQRLEFYRTRGIVHCFRDEYPQAIKDFTFALKEARSVRKARLAHKNNGPQAESRSKGGKKKKGSNKSNGQAPPNGTSAADNAVDGLDGEPLILHPSVLPDAPDPIEPQLLFLRGVALLQQAVFLIESAILDLEAIRKMPSIDGSELRLCYIENGKYGGVEMGHPDGPLGRKDGEKVLAYRRVLAEEGFREQITTLVKKSMRDHERFLAHFDTVEGPDIADSDLPSRMEHAFLLSESIRPGDHSTSLPDTPTLFTTYHPLLVESHFSVLMCQLMLGDFPAILPTFARTASLVDGLEGYPVFLPPRSMAQAEFIETLERLAGGWKNGMQPHSRSDRSQSKARLQIEAPLSPPILAQEITPSPTEYDLHVPSSSTCNPGQSSSSSVTQPPSSGRESPTSSSGRVDLVEALDCARVLLAPVLKRQRGRAEKAAVAKAGGTGRKNPLTINIPLHGPRVEIVLAWLGAVHLFELDTVA